LFPLALLTVVPEAIYARIVLQGIDSGTPWVKLLCGCVGAVCKYLKLNFPTNKYHVLKHYFQLSMTVTAFLDASCKQETSNPSKNKPGQCRPRNRQGRMKFRKAKHWLGETAFSKEDSAPTQWEHIVA